MFFFHYHSLNWIFEVIYNWFLHFNSCILPSIIRHILLHRGIRGIIRGMAWPVFSHSSLNHNENMPYPVWKRLSYRSPHPLYCFKQQKPAVSRRNHLSTGGLCFEVVPWWIRLIILMKLSIYEIIHSYTRTFWNIRTHTDTKHSSRKYPRKKSEDIPVDRRTSCLPNSNMAYSNNDLPEI